MNGTLRGSINPSPLFAAFLAARLERAWRACPSMRSAWYAGSALLTLAVISLLPLCFGFGLTGGGGGVGFGSDVHPQPFPPLPPRGASSRALMAPRS